MGRIPVDYSGVAESLRYGEVTVPDLAVVLGRVMMSGFRAEGSDAAGSELTEPFLATLPVTGASITVISGTTPVTVSASNATASRIEQLQFELGEGPQWEVARSGRPLMFPDARETSENWPVFGVAVAELPVGAIFCFPMQMGAVTLGVATLYSDTPRALAVDAQTTAHAIASAIAGAAVHEAMLSAGELSDVQTAHDSIFRREVHQATGIMLVQLNTSATVAYSRLRAYAFAKGRTVEAVAHDVVAGTLSFAEPTGDTESGRGSR